METETAQLGGGVPQCGGGGIAFVVVEDGSGGKIVHGRNRLGLDGVELYCNFSILGFQVAFRRGYLKTGQACCIHRYFIGLRQGASGYRVLCRRAAVLSISRVQAAAYSG